MNNEYKKYGRFMAVSLYTLEGLYVCLFPPLTNRGYERLTLITTLFFVMSLIVFYFVWHLGERAYFFLELLFFVSSIILAVACTYALNTPYPVLFLFFIQWLVSIAFLNRGLCILLCGCQILSYITMALPIEVLDFHYLSYVEAFAMSLFTFVALWVTLSLCKFINSEILRNVAQERSLDNMIKLTEAMYKEAESLAQSKSDFLSNMSHEIRTPINVMLGMNELILRENASDTIRKYAANIDSSGRLLLSLVNDILDYSKLESGKVTIHHDKYYLGTVLSDVVNMISERARAKGLKLTIDVSPYCPSEMYGDEVKLRQIALNLLTNAIKYTDEGEVTFKVYSQKSGENATLLFFEVSDTGRGIKEEDLGRLFEAFTRLEHQKNRNIEGTGLGLSIIVNYAKLMGGDITVDSTYLKGSTFKALLPQMLEEYVPIGDFDKYVKNVSSNIENYIPLVKAQDAKVLVVDDNIINVNVISLLLKETNVIIDSALSGKEAIDKCRNNQYNIIFLDDMMPEMDGITCLKELKANNLIGSAKVVALTANAIDGAKERYLESGFDDYLSKPILGRDIESMLIKLLPDSLITSINNVDNDEALTKAFIKELPPINGIDWNIASRFFTSKDKLFPILNDFVVNGLQEIDIIEKFNLEDLSGDELNLFKIKVHAIKSIAKMVGAAVLEDEAKMLEEAATRKDSDFIWKNTKEFIADYRNIISEIRGILNIGNEASSVYDRNELLAFAEKIILALEDFDSDSADLLIREVNSFKYPEEIKQYIDNLSNDVLNLNLESAKKTVESLKKVLENQKKNK